MEVAMRITMASWCGTVLATVLGCGSAAATEFVYVPVNPSFGGNPINGAVLLNTAQATNKHKDPAASAGYVKQTPLQQFNDMLERAVLSQLAMAATSDVMGSGGKLKPGVVETGNFRIEIVDSGGGVLTITTTDKLTGATTSFQVGGP
jgi:curli production assembly/transport component CsgF